MDSLLVEKVAGCCSYVAPISLRACYAMSGTDVACACTTRCPAVRVPYLPTRVLRAVRYSRSIGPTYPAAIGPTLYPVLLKHTTPYGAKLKTRTRIPAHAITRYGSYAGYVDGQGA
eukprot:3375339-Rhodomonas_salina.1